MQVQNTHCRYVTIARYGRVIRRGWLKVPSALSLCACIYFVVPLLNAPSLLFQKVHPSTRKKHSLQVEKGDNRLACVHKNVSRDDGDVYMISHNHTVTHLPYGQHLYEANMYMSATMFKLLPCFIICSVR